MQVDGSKVSVGVLLPCRTSVEYTRPAVESILAQTYRDYELLVIDDDAPTETKEYLNSIKDPRIKIISHPTPSGLTASLNEGLEALETDIIVRMDADDIAHPQRIARQVAYMQEHPEVAVLGTQIRLVDAQGIPVEAKNDVPLSHERIKYRLLWSNAINHPAVAYRRAAILAAGSYNPENKSCEDYDLWTRLVANHSFANLPERLLSYRIHPTQKHKVDMKFADNVQAIKLRYRSQITKLPTQLCEGYQRGTVPNWEERLIFYNHLADVFPAGYFRRDIARRLYSEIIAAREHDYIVPTYVTERVKQIHWLFATLKGFFAH